ncbi:hypothetical protein [Nocardia australiensis]|uniref:hypothetical protein n=1 Tax=Nocardia australiensis TaxID=2887191 RepID=UPI001D146C43|nr:hypothetical protein [Nocardia australiensis]
MSMIEHFEGMTHEAMYQAVHGPGGMDAAGLRTLQRTWFANYSDLVNLSTFNLMGMNRIFGNGLWQGVSGDAAQAAAQRFSQAANQIGRVFDSVATRLDSLAWSAETVRAAVQPPSTSVAAPDPNNPAESILPGLINPEYDEQTRTAQEQARQAAIRALNSVYTPNFPPSGTGVPAYTTVPQIGGTDSPNTGAGGNTGANGPGNGNPPDDSTATQNPTGSGTGPGRESDSSTNPAGLGLPEGLLPDMSNAATTPANTTPAGVNPNAPTATGSPGPSPNSTSPGGPGGSSSQPGGPGSTQPDTPGTSPVGAGAASTGARGGTGTTAGRMGPMAPGAGARKKDDDEAEHFAPDYLRRVHSEWTEGIASPDGAIGADSAPEYGAGFHSEDMSLDYTAPRPTPASSMDSAPPDPPAPVESAPTPPVTFTGVGPMDPTPEPPAR